MQTDIGTGKVLFISRGPSGSGKSFEIGKYVPREYIFSTDDYWGVDYNFDPSKLHQAHLWNQNRTKNAMEQGFSPIGVDNTNLTYKEMKPYIENAKEYGYEVKYIESTSPWWKEISSRYPFKQDDIEYAAEILNNKNQHGVPLETLKRMLQRWTPTEKILTMQESKLSFKEYFSLLGESKSDNAYIFDLDDTLITTGASVIVKNTAGDVINKLTPAEYNTYQKKSDEVLDFSEFESAENFESTVKPTKYFSVIQNISNAIKDNRSNSFIYILTARGNKIKEPIYKYLTKIGVKIRMEEIYTIGDRDLDNRPISVKKKEVIQQIRDKHIGDVTFFDDDEKNIMLAQEVPGVKTRLVK